MAAPFPDTEAGFLVFALPSPRPATDAISEIQVGADTTWSLRVTMTRAERAYVTLLTKQQSAFQLFSSVLATLFSVLATWKGLFMLLEVARESPTFKQFMLIGGDAGMGHFFYDHGKPVTETQKWTAYPGCYALSKVLEECMLEQYYVQY